MEGQKTQNSQYNIEGEQISRIDKTRLQNYYKAAIIKTKLCWRENREIDQWNKIDSTEVNSRYSRLIFDKEAKVIQQSKYSPFNK